MDLDKFLASAIFLVGITLVLAAIFSAIQQFFHLQDNIWLIYQISVGLLIIAYIWLISRFS